MCWLAALTACLSPTLRAHEIPADTTVRAFIKPDGARLRFLIRVPMAAIRDIEWPVRRVDGSLDIPIVEPALRDAVGLWITSYVDMFEGLTKLPEPDLIAVRLSLEDNAFASYQDALAAVTGPKIPDDTRLQPKQGMLDTLLEYPIQSDRSRFSFHPRFDHFGLRVATILRFQTPDGAVRAFEYRGRQSGPHPAGSHVVSSRVDLRHDGVPPHPRRSRPPAVPVLPRDSVPQVRHARSCRDRLHRGAFGDPHRIGLRHGARGRCGFPRSSPRS